MFIIYQRKTLIKILILKREKIIRVNDELFEQNFYQMLQIVFKFFLICVNRRLSTSDLLRHHIF